MSAPEPDAANAEKVFQALAKTFEQATASVELSVAEIIEIGRIFHQTAVLYALQMVESEADQEVIKNAAVVTFAEALLPDPDGAAAEGEGEAEGDQPPFG